MLRIWESGIFRRPLYNFWFERADEMFFSPISALPYDPPSLTLQRHTQKKEYRYGTFNHSYR